MKKHFGLFILSVVFSLFTLCGGILLSACSNGGECQIVILNDDENLSKAIVKVGGEEVSSEDGVYKVQNGANVRVEVYSTAFAVDFSKINIFVNNQKREFFENSQYQPLTNETEKYAGYFLIARISENINVSISNVAQKTSTFSFEKLNEISEVDETKLKAISVNTSLTEGEYVSLYDIVSGEIGNVSYTRPLSNLGGIFNTQSTLKVKFSFEDMFDTSYAFLKIRFENGDERGFGSCFKYEDYFYIDFGMLGFDSDFTIVTDCEQLKFNSYNISVPKENLTYSISLSSQTLNYGSEETLTLTKNLDEPVADYSQMIVKLNNQQLTQVVSEIGRDITYALPHNCTPISTGGESKFVISVEGISYGNTAHTLNLQSEEPNRENAPFLTYAIGDVLEEDGDLTIFGIDDNGTQVTLEGRTVGVDWNYSTFAEGYHSAYELYNYSIMINEVKIFNLGEVLSSATNNFANLNDISQTIAEKYQLKAKFNSSTNCFDKFRLTFVCEEDVNLKFTNFALENKKVDIGYNFTDERLTSIQFAIINEGDEVKQWRTLTTETENMSIEYGQVVVFKLLSNKNSSFTKDEFTIENKNAFLSMDAEQLTEENGIILKFRISDLHVDGSIPFLLVKVQQEAETNE